MLAIIGAAGRVGYPTAAALRERGAPIRAILRDPGKAMRLEAIGCEVAIADLQRPASLVEALAGASAVQLIVPLRPDAVDPVEDMRESIDSLIEALTAVRPARLLAISDYGAHQTKDVGMPSLFHVLERRVSQLGGRKTFLRSAEHMHNLAGAVTAALHSGTFPTFQDPLNMVQPAIAAHDLGRIAADLLLNDPVRDVEVVHAEGPRRYSAIDIAAVLSEISGRRITARAVPRAAWQETLERSLPPSLASLLVRTNDAKNEGGVIDVDPQAGGAVRYGATELIDAIRQLLTR